MKVVKVRWDKREREDVKMKMGILVIVTEGEHRRRRRGIAKRQQRIEIIKRCVWMDVEQSREIEKQRGRKQKQGWRDEGRGRGRQCYDNVRSIDRPLSNLLPRSRPRRSCPWWCLWFA